MSERKCDNDLLREAKRFAKELSVEGLTAMDSLRLKVISCKRQVKIIDAYNKEVTAKS